MRVLLSVPDFGYPANPIADGFRACGCDVATQVEEKRGGRGFRANDWLSKIADFVPDMVLWMNRPELSRLASDALRGLGIASVHWSVDSPLRMKLTPSDLELVDVHQGGPGPRISRQLSLAAGIRPLPGCRPEDSPWPRRLGPDVSFVRSLGESRVAELRSLFRARELELLNYLEELSTMSGDPAAAFEEKTGRPYEGDPCIYVDEARSARRRIEVLSALPLASLKIFGGGEWARAGGPVARSYAGRAVPYGNDLASLYYHSKININVFHEQCIDSTNSRVYDVLAAGGFLLTEYRPCLEREFEIGRHFATFRTGDEARAKVDYYLSRPQEREAMARVGQGHVLREHTFEERFRTLL